MTPLHWAVERKHKEIVQYLMNNYLKQINFDIADKFGRKLIDLAKKNNNEEMVELIERYKLLQEKGEIEWISIIDEIVFTNGQESSPNSQILNVTTAEEKSFSRRNEAKPSRDESQPCSSKELLEDTSLEVLTTDRTYLAMGKLNSDFNETYKWLQEQFKTNSSNDIFDDLYNGRNFSLTGIKN